MSRPTDTERGARIARDTAFVKLNQGDLFRKPRDRKLWQSILDRADETLEEERACRRELSDSRARDAWGLNAC